MSLFELLRKEPQLGQIVLIMYPKGYLEETRGIPSFATCIESEMIFSRGRIDLTKEDEG